MPKEIYIDENGNERILSSSPSALSGLLDTDITTPTQSGQVLAYNGSKWGNTYPEIYSTTETVVGKWIDNKLIYQKVIPINFTTQATWNNVETINGITRIISADFLVYEGGNRTNGIRQGMFAEISTTVPYLVQIFNNTGYDIQVDYLILTYIKS